LAILENGQYVVAGITSWGEGCGFKGYPGIFSRVTSVLPWIKKILGPDLKHCLPKSIVWEGLSYWHPITPFHSKYIVLILYLFLLLLIKIFESKYMRPVIKK
jgi:secreted trypsin-like serine protease